MKFFLLVLLFASSVFATSNNQRGKLEITTFDDFERERSYEEIRLVTKDHRNILVLSNGTEGLKDKNGKFLEGNQIVEFGDIGPRTTIFAKEVTVIETPSKFGKDEIRNSLLIVAHFQDVKVTCPTSEIEDGLFGAKNSVDQLYRDMSDNTTGITKGSSLTVTINVKSTDTCTSTIWADLADSAARSAGLDPNNYQQLLYVFPKSTCNIAGVASGRRAINLGYCSMPDVLAHEVGHNLGLKHASTLDNSYGDTSDIMGYANSILRGLNGPHKIQMNWIDPAQVVTLSATRNLSIPALNQSAGQAGAPQIYKVLRNDGSFLYLSYRQPMGYDQRLGPISTQGVSIHTWAGGAVSTFLLGILKDGQTFYDFKKGVTVFQRSHNSSGVNVDASITGIMTSGAPVNLRGSVVRGKKSKVVLTWDAPRDGVTIKDYLVVRNGSVVSTATSLTYSDQAVSKGNEYTYSIVTRNAEGKFSPESAPVSLKVTK